MDFYTGTLVYGIAVCGLVLIGTGFRFSGVRNLLMKRIVGGFSSVTGLAISSLDNSLLYFSLKNISRFALLTGVLLSTTTELDREGMFNNF